MGDEQTVEAKRAADERLAALVEAGWVAGRFGPLTGRIEFRTRNRVQLARAVKRLRKGR